MKGEKLCNYWDFHFDEKKFFFVKTPRSKWFTLYSYFLASQTTLIFFRAPNGDLWNSILPNIVVYFPLEAKKELPKYRSQKTKNNMRHGQNHRYKGSEEYFILDILKMSWQYWAEYLWCKRLRGNHLQLLNILKQGFNFVFERPK